MVFRPFKQLTSEVLENLLQDFDQDGPGKPMKAIIMLVSSKFGTTSNQFSVACRMMHWVGGETHEVPFNQAISRAKLRNSTSTTWITSFSSNYTQIAGGNKNVLTK